MDNAKKRRFTVVTFIVAIVLALIARWLFSVTGIEWLDALVVLMFGLAALAGSVWTFLRIAYVLHERQSSLIIAEVTVLMAVGLVLLVLGVVVGYQGVVRLFSSF